MNTTTCTHKDNPNFWIFGLFFFLYFFIMATCFPFLPIWLSDIIGLNKTHTGIVFSCISLSAIAFQPVLGVISDKLGLKKHLLWIISVLLFLFAPFFLYVFAPLLKTNIWLGALSGGLYIGFVFSAGSGAIEAYIERVSRNSFFEYGKARMFGCLGWGAVRLNGRHPVRHRSVVCFLDGIGGGAVANAAAGGRETEAQPDGAGHERPGREPAADHC